jgi:hypothetical protein
MQGSFVWLAAGAVGPGFGHVGRAPWLGSVGTPELAVPIGQARWLQELTQLMMY